MKQKSGFGERVKKKFSEWHDNRIFLRNYKDSEGIRILQEWEAVWKQRNPEDKSVKDFFYTRFIEDYRITFLRSRKNRTRNFIWKMIFLFVMFGSLLCCGLLFYHSYLQKAESLFKSSISSGGLLAFVMFACGIVSKWLDIKQYQSTWVRHTNLLQRLNCEMLLYIYGMKYYSQFDKEEVFIQRVLDIWMNNLNKFTKNMEQNEKEMMDIFKKLRSE